MIDKRYITGLVLAGGRGSRMGGLDKGLVPHHGEPLARHALRRLAPQVGQMAVNANRNLPAYEAMGVEVWPDAVADYPGPLAGLLAGLMHCSTPYLAVVPCDSPRFPLDLVMRLSGALADTDAEVAMAATSKAGERRLQPVFCLMRADVAPSLSRFLQSGQRKIETWGATQRRIDVLFDDAEAFANVNTADELQRLEASS